MNRRMVLGALAAVVALAVVIVIVAQRNDDGPAGGPRASSPNARPTASVADPPPVPAEFEEAVAVALGEAGDADVGSLETFLATEDGARLTETLTAILTVREAEVASCTEAPAAVEAARSPEFLDAAAAVPDRPMNEAALAAAADAQALATACAAPGADDPTDLATRLRLDAAVYRGRLDQAGIEP